MGDGVSLPRSADSEHTCGHSWDTYEKSIDEQCLLGLIALLGLFALCSSKSAFTLVLATLPLLLTPSTLMIAVIKIDEFSIFSIEGL